MARSIVIIALAVVCGVASAIGVNQVLSREPAKETTGETKSVWVAATRIGRGEELTEGMLMEQQWPVQLIPTDAVRSPKEAVGRVAMSTILQGAPVFNGMLTGKSGEGFIASIIKDKMRAYTIQTRGPTASVAGFVRPQDRVDVLVSLKDRSTDESGGASTFTLLQSVEILAIDQIIDPNADPLKMLEMWTKGDNFTSVTLQVTLDQAELLALGQSHGELSLALRNAKDETTDDTPMPATITGIKTLRMLVDPDAGDDAASSGTGPRSQPVAMQSPYGEEPPPAPVTYIHTLRGSNTGRVRVHSRPNGDQSADLD